MRAAVIEKNNQFFRRYRPVNTFITREAAIAAMVIWFLPAMRNFDIMVQNRDRRIAGFGAGQRPAGDEFQRPSVADHGGKSRGQ